MEYMYGGDLGNIINKYGCLPHLVARMYVAEIIIAVDNLHRVGVVHRDLKPENVLLDPKGHLKLIDFGLSDIGLQTRLNNKMFKNFESDIQLVKSKSLKSSELVKD